MSIARGDEEDREALDRLIPSVYAELHRIAEAFLRRESRNHTLQPTALIHEAYLRLIEHGAGGFRNRTHFFSVAARVMRHVLVDHARAKQAAKRNAATDQAPTGQTRSRHEPPNVVSALDDALRALSAYDPKKAVLIELRFFGGMNAEEIAACVEMPVHIVRRELRAAQAWLRREIEPRR